MAPLLAFAEPLAALDEAVSGAEPHDPLPPGSLTVGGLYTDDYWEGIGDVLVPLYFNGQGLFFINPRTSRTDNDASEFNLGLGYRQLIREREAIVGANLYYDYRDTTAGAQFHQVGVGLEYLSKHLDLRANIYAPTETREKVNEFSTTETSTSRSASREVRVAYDDPYATGHAVLQDYEQISLTRTTTTTLTTTRFYEQYEIAFWGWDAEIGTEWSIPGLDDLIRIKPFAGVVNYYGRSGVSDIEAFRGRLEVHVGPSFFLDAVYLSDDGLNGGNFAVGAYLSLPFEIGNIAQGRSPFSGPIKPRYTGNDISWRLGEMVKRDPQIRSTVAAPEERKDKLTSTTETTRSTRTEDLGTGTAVILDDVTFVNNANSASPDQDGTAENPYDSVQDGVDNANSPVWVYTGNAPYEENVEVPEGVQLYGQGTIIQALGGKTWGGGTHPVLIAPNPGPAVTILGNNVAVSGFDIRHTGAGESGGVISSIVINEDGYQYDITHAGIFGRDVSDLQLHDNIMRDGSLGNGIVLLSDGSLQDGNINLVATLLNNDIQDAAFNGLVINAVGGSGEFNVEVSGNYAFSGEDGIRLWSDGHDTASADLYDITANDNGGYGVTAWVEASDLAWLRVQRTITDRNEEGLDGGAVATGAGGEAHIIMNDIQANDNESWGLYYAYAESVSADGGDAEVRLNTITANNNAYGMDIYAYAYGAGAHAVIIADGLEANGNQHEGIYGMGAYSGDGSALVDVRNVTASENGGYGIEYIYAESYGTASDSSVVLSNVAACNNANDGLYEVGSYARYGDARVALDHVTANENDGRGLNNLSARSVHGAAAVTLNAVDASFNSEYGIDYIVASAGDLLAFSDAGGGAGATIQLTDVTTDGNGYAGIFEITAESNGGDSTVVLDSVQANLNARYGIEYIQARAYGDAGNASVTVRNTEASGNLDEDGFDRIFAEATGVDSDAAVTIQDMVANNNENNGIRSVEARAVDGAASASLSNIEARFNGGYGVDRVDAAAGGAGDPALITFIDSDLRDNTSGGYNALTPTATGGGTADTDVQDVLQ